MFFFLLQVSVHSSRKVTGINKINGRTQIALLTFYYTTRIKIMYVTTFKIYHFKTNGNFYYFFSARTVI